MDLRFSPVTELPPGRPTSRAFNSKTFRGVLRGWSRAGPRPTDSDLRPYLPFSPSFRHAQRCANHASANTEIQIRRFMMPPVRQGRDS